MDDLYGDLNDNNESLIGSGWTQDISNLTHKTNSVDKTKDTENKQNLSSTSISVKSNTPTINKNFKPVSISSSSSFKPRQTTVASTNVFAKSQFSATTTTTTEVRKKVVHNEIQGDNIMKNSMNPDLNKSSEYINESSTFDVENPYDPMKPNDYLLYCEEREELKKKKKLEEENLKYLEELEKERNERAKERLDAASEGDIQRVEAMGRGRGRGLSNLPAWMSQQAAAQKPSEPSSDADTQPQLGGAIRAGENRSANSRILLLQNMISYDDVDDSLEKETKEECSKYGIVEKCVVHIGRNSSGNNEKPAVRIFVAFKYPEAASKAQNDLNGRFFGGRKVAASYFDEIRFMHQDYDD